jgi:hypothetical protein
VQAPGIDRGDPAKRPRTGADGVAAGLEGRRGDTEPPRFSRLLQARKPSQEGRGAKAGSSAALGAMLEGGRPSLPLTPIAREVSVRAVAPAPQIARLLIGQAHASREARIELGGRFAGSSIHVVTAPGGVEVRLGAPTEAARLALASVIDRVGLHLRSRGIVMRSGASLETGSRQRQRDGRERR